MNRGKINYRKMVIYCHSDELCNVLEEIEKSSLHPKKKCSLKIKMAKRKDAPKNILRKLQNENKGAVKFWAQDTIREQGLTNQDFKII